jgi:hypothetical protein
MSSRSDEVRMWVKATVWSLAITFAVAGVVLSVVLGSLWPLVAFSGLAVPMIPVTASRRARTGASGSS